ncbi:hypothetical protein FMUND_10904 [Fusarium mundagurra]|uniref:Uncharacterized protein n=1 Tax=Fusarium mundagurra TaxID=1567541 RepID=A0A8H6D906_9HYPO|nr:hypothetical protein FMUND_10904 [Fusarium mundagurra]
MPRRKKKNPRTHSAPKSPKGKEPARSKITYFEESPDEDGPSTNASKDTNMASAATGTASEASSSKAGAHNPFSPSSLSIGPRPDRGWRPHLPVFSSHDFEEPRGEARRPNNNVNNDNTTQTPQDIRKRSFTTNEKCQAIEMCLSLTEEYLAMPLALHHDQRPFWAKVLSEKLDRSLAAKIKTWKSLKELVDYWCMVRRTLLREGRLPAVSQSQPELDTLVDSWNKVFVQRFCRIYKGYFESASGAQLPVPRAVTLPMASSDQSQLPELSEDVAGNQPRRQRQRSPLRGPPEPRPSAPSNEERQSRSAGRFSRSHDSQYPDTWLGDRETHRRYDKTN